MNMSNMKKFFLLTAWVVSVVFSGYSQTVIENYPTNFTTQDQNLWRAGTAGAFEIDHSFFNMSWDESVEFGPVYNVAGFDFGAEVSAGTSGEIGAGFELNFGTEQVSIDYSGDMRIERPADLTFNRGEAVSLQTAYAPDIGASNIVTDTYDTDMRLYLKFGMAIDLAAKVCMFDCANVNLVDLNLPETEYDMVEISSATGIGLLDGLYSWGTEEAFPFKYSDSYGIITLDVILPSNAGANIYMQGNELHSNADPSDPYFNVYYSIPKFIGALKIPYVSAFFANLSNSYSDGPFYLNYILMESGFNLGLYHKQHLILDPELKAQLDLPLAVDYEIVDPGNGSVISQGNSSEINYTPGQEVRFDYPCHYEFMEVTPSFEIDNNFSNHTYDSIALDFVFQMLEIDMGMDPIEVVPRKCGDVPYPCPSWDDPFKICWEEVCTPAVGFDGFSTGFGPLVDWQPNMAELTYDWRRSDWTMEGFNSYQDQPPFKLQPASMEALLTSQDIDCYGESNGELTVTVQNGSPPYIYEWSNGAQVTSNSSENTQVALDAGVHYVVVTDANGCSVFASSEITQPEAPLAVTGNVTDLTCYQAANGNIDVDAEGGTPDYDFLWSNSETTEDISGLQAGDYTLTLTDANGCLLTETFTVNQPEELTAEFTKQDVKCRGNNTGSVNIEASGGVAPYTYLWPDGQTGKSRNNLSAGTYEIIVSDANGCSLNLTVEILEPAETLAVSTTASDVKCFGASDGAIEASVSGGTEPYNYSWSDSSYSILSQSGEKLQNIPAGSYHLEVTDANNCIQTISTSVEQPDEITHSFTVEDVLCKGLAEGSIEAEISGGTQPYTFQWSNGDETQNISQIPAGEYELVVTDANDCRKNFSARVSEPGKEFTVNTEVTDVKCFGETTGEIIAFPQGGVEPYTYDWSNGSSDSIISNLSAGNYTLTAKDDNGCTYYSGGVVSQPQDPLEVSSEVSHISCFGYNDGSVKLDIFGGSLPYSITWDNNTHVLNENQQIVDNRGPGFLSVKIADANNCSVSRDFYIESPDPVDIDLDAGLVSCYEGSDAVLSASVTGGTEPFVYEWSNGETGQTLEAIPAGNYKLELTDANGCVYEASKEVFSFSEITVDYRVQAPSCKDIDDGEVNLTPDGGAGEYSYNWSDGQQTQNAQNLAPGYYSVVIIDKNNCEKTFEFDVPYNYSECLEIPTVFTPNGDGKNDTWVITGMEAYPNASVQVFNKWGKLLYEHSGIYEPWDGTFKGQSLPSETYYYIINLNNGDEPYTGTVTILR